MLEHGQLSASEITSKTKHKRGMVYKFLEDLKNKNLISTTTKNKKTYFRPLNPNNLLDSLQNKRKEINSQLTSLEAVLPELNSAYLMNEVRPTIMHFEGIAGIKKVFEDIYSPKEEPVYGCVDLEKSDEAVPEYIIKKLIPKRIKNKVKAISFVANSKQAEEVHSNDAQALRESKLIDKKKYPLPAEIDVYEDKVALLSFDKKKFAGILIQNKDIATSLKSIFKLAFDNTPEKV